MIVTMAAKLSDDPMDLGGFMQNFVLSNPFKEIPGISGSNTKPEVEPPDHISQPSNASSPVSNHSNIISFHDNSEGDLSEGQVTLDKVGQVLDTPKAHVGSNVSYANALKLQQVPQPRIRVQTWLKKNYCHVTNYPGLKETKSLLSEVNEHFPHVTGIILSKVMTFTFPDCPKITNINGSHGYRGLVAKPQPEDYCNLDLLKAASHAKVCGSVSAAADQFNVPESAVASLHYWHPDMCQPSEDGEEEEEEEEGEEEVEEDGAEAPQEGDKRGRPKRDKKDKDYVLPPSAKRAAIPQSKTRRSKRRKLPVNFCDPDSLSELEEEPPVGRSRRKSAHSESNGSDLGSIVKEEIPEEESSNQASLLKNLLKKQTKDVKSEHLNTPLVIKSEPVDPGYMESEEGLCSEKSGGQGIKLGLRKEPGSKKWKRSRHSESRDENEIAYPEEPLDMCVTGNSFSSTGTGDSLDQQVEKLQQDLASRESETEKLRQLLAASKKEVSTLRSILVHREESMTELVHDFSCLHEQFAKLTNKFMSTLTSIEQDKSKLATTTPSGKKRKSNPTRIKQNGVS